MFLDCVLLQVKHHVSEEQKQEAHGDASLVEEYLRINCTLEAETQRLCAQLQAYQVKAHDDALDPGHVTVFET